MYVVGVELSDQLWFEWVEVVGGFGMELLQVGFLLVMGGEVEFVGVVEDCVECFVGFEVVCLLFDDQCEFIFEVEIFVLVWVFYCVVGFGECVWFFEKNVGFGG